MMNTNYEDIIRRSVSSDFKIKNKNKTNHIIRIDKLHDDCYYFKFSRYILKKAMIKVEGNNYSTTGYYKFAYDEDRKKLNSAAGWSDRKDKYKLEKPTIK